MKIDINKLRHHPINSEIYNLSSIDELSDSINRMGLLQPLTIDQHNQIISGNRRFEAIQRLGWKKVEVNKIKVNPRDEVLLLIHFNKQRVKSISELLAEYDQLRKYYKSQPKGKIKNLREVVSDDIKVSDGTLARILYIRKHNPEMIQLIEDGILTINQAYLQCQRTQKELHTLSLDSVKFEKKNNNKLFRFYQKSSDKMNELKDGEVTTIFTSPPYFSKRVYSRNGGLGNENTSDEYVNNLVCHLKDSYRVLHSRGSFFLNLGDTFVDGNLQNIPHKVVIKLQEYGWILRNSIIWSKSNPKPSSSKTNLTPSYEFIFHLVKSLDYLYSPTLTEISGKTKPSLPPRHRSPKGNSMRSMTPYIPNPNGKNMGDFWSEDIVRTAVVNQKKDSDIQHPAMFPEQIVYLPILQTCVYPFINNNSISPLILDHFCGNLTTYNVCKNINDEYGTELRFVGYDIKKYF